MLSFESAASTRLRDGASFLAALQPALEVARLAQLALVPGALLVLDELRVEPARLAQILAGLPLVLASCLVLFMPYVP